MRSGCEATKTFLKTHGEFNWFSFHGNWGNVVRAAYEESLRTEVFAGAWVVKRVGYFPSLRPLASCGILEKVGDSTRGGERAYYRMPDPDGVACALRQLGLL